MHNRLLDKRGLDITGGRARVVRPPVYPHLINTAALFFRVALEIVNDGVRGETPDVAFLDGAIQQDPIDPPKVGHRFLQAVRVEGRLRQDALVGAGRTLSDRIAVSPEVHLILHGSESRIPRQDRRRRDRHRPVRRFGQVGDLIAGRERPDVAGVNRGQIGFYLIHAPVDNDTRFQSGYMVVDRDR